MLPDDAPAVRALETGSALVDALHETIDRADEEVMLATSPTGLDRVADPLAAAIERDVLVWVVLYGGPGTAGTALDDVATIARTWPGGADGLTTLVADGRAGVVAPERLLTGVDAERTGTNGTAFVDTFLEHLASVFFVAQVWSMGREVLVPLPVELPREFQQFRRTVMEATLHLRRRSRVLATVDASPTDDRDRRRTVTGEVINVRQRTIAPSTSGFVGETTLILRTDEGRVTVGGRNAYVEDYVAHAVTLSLADGRAPGDVRAE